MKPIYRHGLKTITWRLIGTMDTIIISRIVTGSWIAGFSIGGIEVISKMILYFFHERVWYKLLTNKSTKDGKKLTK